MAECTFFGHRDCPDSIEPILRKTIEKLIVDNGVNVFLVGDSGNFDKTVFRVLRDLEGLYNIKIMLVLSKFPKQSDPFNDYSVLPDEVLLAPSRFAIDCRNRFMLNRCDYVVTYTVCDFGGAFKYETMARKKNKTVINVATLAD